MTRSPPSLLLAVLLLALFTPTLQHAYLAFPPSRNYQAFTMPPDTQKYFCPHCGQGGGAGHTPGMCGDPFQNVVGDSSFVPFTDRFYAATTLTAGSTVNIRITVSTNHGGRMSVAICPLPRGQVTPACFAQPQNRLRRVDSNPAYNNKWYWYLNTGNMVSAETTYKLPDGVTCEDGCMLQWWWVGYQSCTLPCEDSSVDVPGECGTNPLNPPVSQCSSILQTEQFLNCADIILTANGGGSTDPTPTPVISPPTQTLPPPVVQSPSPTTESPTPTTSPSPSLSPSSTPTPSETCPASDWRCSSCVQRASTSAAASGLVEACYSCAASCSSQPSACWQCLTASDTPEVIQGCMDCVTGGLPSWQCETYCAKKASNSAEMDQCVSCLKTPDINTWGCTNCFDQAGSGGDLGGCLACVASGIDSWACGQCAGKPNSAACYSCLASAGADTYPCIA